MENKIVETHDFNNSKKKIHEFSKDIPYYVSLTKSKEDGGLFGWFNHTVTGEELNKLVGEVQDKFIQSNESIRKIIGEFKEVYNAFEALDKDYITGILVALDNADKAQKKANKAQEDTDKTIDAIQNTIKVLKRYREQTVVDVSEINDRLNMIEHLCQQTIDIAAQYKRQTDIEIVNMKNYIKGYMSAINQSKEIPEEAIMYMQKTESLLNSSMTENTIKDNEKYIKQKFFYAYLISGCSLFLALLHIVMNLIGIL
ncbi:hypothetical protein [uncultured Parabacteroides sp.]|uniref:hypothetical protein n=1 Tax=uncultured Parabacteroides sp. TaxID=512312 RepID=UPI0025DB6F6F|nr:hypothetical protein [uncultured Parabacteroides sp.]